MRCAYAVRYAGPKSLLEERVTRRKELPTRCRHYEGVKRTYLPKHALTHGKASSRLNRPHSTGSLDQEWVAQTAGSKTMENRCDYCNRRDKYYVRQKTDATAKLFRTLSRLLVELQKLGIKRMGRDVHAHASPLHLQSERSRVGQPTERRTSGFSLDANASIRRFTHCEHLRIGGSVTRAPRALV